MMEPRDSQSNSKVTTSYRLMRITVYLACTGMSSTIAVRNVSKDAVRRIFANILSSGGLGLDTLDLRS